MLQSTNGEERLKSVDGNFAHSRRNVLPPPAQGTSIILLFSTRLASDARSILTEDDFEQHLFERTGEGMAKEEEHSATPVVETTEKQDDSSNITDEQWAGMGTVLKNIYDYRADDGSDPSHLFHRKVNKRSLPDYYTVIKEPMAMSTIKAKVNSKEYKDFSEFVRDFALIPHNAQVYNVPNSQAFQDALTIKKLLEGELQKLVEAKIISEETAKLPFLGEIPTADELPPEEPEEDDEEEEGEGDDDDDEEDDELGDDSDEDGRKKRRRGPRSTAAIIKREGRGKDKDEEDPEVRKKRGRPVKLTLTLRSLEIANSSIKPRVDTPMEARIKNIMKSLRKFKGNNGQLKVLHFERLPDKATMPEYYAEVKNPIALDVIKKKLKRKKYSSIDQFMKDVELMFENAKAYNQDGSTIYKDAVDLQKEARVLAQAEKEKPDSEYVMEDGRIPLPDGILHNGELWKVGDWVHLQNANDLTKPIVAQIYRTWQDQDGGKWVNACWYYRPEQTVHRFDRHFYENEVVKTGQYRDHPIDEVIDRCFVMFFTRYNRGRPRNFPSDKEIYVCESRYNEEKHKLNKIKTWASCLPDEVRDKDYEMDLFDAPKKIKKLPSPIKYLFKEEEQKETDDLPKPVWGAPNAPPKIGAVHCRPRDPKESPPPEPTPTPPPVPPSAPARELPTPSLPRMPNGYTANRPPNIAMPPSAPHTGGAHPTPTPTQLAHPTPTYTPSHPSQYHHSASPAPIQTSQQPHHQPTYGSHTPLTPSTSFASRPPIAPSAGPQYPSPAQQQSFQHPTQPALHPRPGYTGPTALPGYPGGYQAPPPVETYRLDNYADALIPPEIRAQFNTDEQGRVIWFTVPPRNDPPPYKPPSHSAKYLAWRAQNDEEIARKRAEREKEEVEEREARRVQKVEEQKQRTVEIEEGKRKALRELNGRMMDNLVATYRNLYGEKWKEKAEEELTRLGKKMGEQERLREEVERKQKEAKERESSPWGTL